MNEYGVLYGGSTSGSLCVTIQMKATEQFFPVVCFPVQAKMVLTFESVDEILCEPSYKLLKIYYAELSQRYFFSASLECCPPLEVETLR